MIVFDFIYFSIYTLVPNKAIFGKRDVACTYYSSFAALFLLFFFINCTRILEFRINIKLFVIILALGLAVGLFVLIRVIYLKPEKFKSMHRKFRKIPKWLLKTIGIMYIVFCFFGMIGISILTDKYLGM